jgi:monovalent cation/proton antiporter MnhG/PhaG subunit
VDVLVVAGVAGAVLSTLGVVLMRTVYDRLHYAMALTTVPPLLVAVAVMVCEGWTASGLGALVAAAFMFLLNPAAAIAVARSARARRRESGS